MDFAREQFRLYRLGTRVNIESDHRPLESIVWEVISLQRPRVQNGSAAPQVPLILKKVPDGLMLIADTLTHFAAARHCEAPDMEDSEASVLASLVVSDQRHDSLTLWFASDPAI